MTSLLPEDQIAERIAQIRQTLPDAVRLIAVTKQIPVERMRIAYEAGIRDFGENRVQEAATKQTQLADLTDVTWHMIGHLQRNKAAKAVELFPWIHSVDNLQLAQRLNQSVRLTQSQDPDQAQAVDQRGPQYLAKHLAKPKVCLQVKIVPDPNKYGWTIPELIADLPALNECCQLEIVGLMVIPPYGLPTSETLAIFMRARQLAEEIQQQDWSNISIRELSMGMSDDYSLAIQAGATCIRLGRTLFGERK